MIDKNSEAAWSDDLVYRITALGFLLQPVGFWAIRPLVLLLAAVSVLHPRVLRSPWTWLGFFSLTGLRIIEDWPLPDNHAYLLSYWCLALFLGCLLRQRGAIPALNGRMMIGLVFVLAVIWKAVLSPDYLDGTFFRVTFLTDDRFTDAMLLFGGFDKQYYFTMRDALVAWPEGMIPATRAVLEEPARFSLLVNWATWGTVLFEAVVAALFLISTRWCARLRHGVLMAFCAVTYAVAPVIGFGWLLLTLGLAQCDRDQRTTRYAYLATYALLLFYKEVPWMNLILDG